MPGARAGHFSLPANNARETTRLAQTTHNGAIQAGLEPIQCRGVDRIGRRPGISIDSIRAAYFVLRCSIFRLFMTAS
jgi:hypothetical protein